MKEIKFTENEIENLKQILPYPEELEELQKSNFVDVTSKKIFQETSVGKHPFI